MDKHEIINELELLFRDIFADEELVLSGETSAEDIEDWDSLSNIRLTVNIEKRFDIKFSFDELQKIGNVDDMVELILDKITQKKELVA